MSASTSPDSSFDSSPEIAESLGLKLRAVQETLILLADTTVPFIARYRKEATGGLDEVAIRHIQERHLYLTELEARRQSILSSVEEQGKLSPELRQRIEACQSKSALEDLYLPYKRRRQTRASKARDRGLLPLAKRILKQPMTGHPQSEARAFQGEKVPDFESALAGARDIIAEWVAEEPRVRSLLRERFWTRGQLCSKQKPKAPSGRSRFEQYYDYSEAVKRIPSHRYLAMRRGEEEGLLKLKIVLDIKPLLFKIEKLMGLRPRSPFAEALRLAIQEGYKRLLQKSLEAEVLKRLKERADEEAVEVFARNLRDLLLAAPLGELPVIAVDPGLRTGSKCVALDANGTLRGQLILYLSRGTKELKRAEQAFKLFFERHRPRAIAVGNGTGGRESLKILEAWLKVWEPQVLLISVNEAGASIYSASDIARQEFPQLDLSFRGAISIGRRLQDPLAELVKIDPKSMGVGQYQHDVHQPLLKRKLAEIVESCVNHVGVRLNTASAPLLAQVAGIGPGLAQKILKYREEKGPFKHRQALLKVPGLGPKTFRQCAGFLRILDGDQALDASAVHPERYKLVAQMAADLGLSLNALMKQPERLEALELERYQAKDLGLPTHLDILAELQRPGLDPRQEFEAPRFREDVQELEDLQQGMILEGVVSNVTHFGAFVDLGVHQDGLIHISQLADHFVKDPHDVVSPGQRLRVMVLEIDLERRRISLSARGLSQNRS